MTALLYDEVRREEASPTKTKYLFAVNRDCPHVVSAMLSNYDARKCKIRSIDGHRVSASMRREMRDSGYVLWHDGLECCLTVRMSRACYAIRVYSDFHADKPYDDANSFMSVTCRRSSDVDAMLMRLLPPGEAMLSNTYRAIASHRVSDMAFDTNLTWYLHDATSGVAIDGLVDIIDDVFPQDSVMYAVKTDRHDEYGGIVIKKRDELRYGDDDIDCVRLHFHDMCVKIMLSDSRRLSFSSVRLAAAIPDSAMPNDLYRLVDMLGMSIESKSGLFAVLGMDKTAIGEDAMVILDSDMTHDKPIPSDTVFKRARASVEEAFVKGSLTCDMYEGVIDDAEERWNENMSLIGTGTDMNELEASNARIVASMNEMIDGIRKLKRNNALHQSNEVINDIDNMTSRLKEYSKQ